MKNKMLNSKMTSKIHIKFQREIIQNTNFIELILEIENENNINGSHVTYSCKLNNLKNKDLTYYFKAFHQDNYCVLICDIFNESLRNFIEYKNIFVFPIEWKLSQINGTSLWILDIPESKNIKMYILNIRKRLKDIPRLQEFIQNTEYNEIDIEIQNYKNENKKIKRNLIKSISSYFTKKSMIHPQI